MADETIRTQRRGQGAVEKVGVRVRRQRPRCPASGASTYGDEVRQRGSWQDLPLPPTLGWLFVFLVLFKNMFDLQNSYILVKIKTSNKAKFSKFFTKYYDLLVSFPSPTAPQSMLKV